MDRNSKAAVVSTVGYLCLGLVGWMFSMGAAAWFPKSYGLAITYPLVFVLAVMGVLAFVVGRGLDSIVFFSGTALWGAACAGSVAVGADKTLFPSGYLGWFAIIWAIFFCYVWAGSFKSGVTRMLFLLGACLTMMALAVGCWAHVSGFIVLGGYIGLATSIVAMIVSANEVIRPGTRSNLNLETTGTTAKPIAAD